MPHGMGHAKSFFEDSLPDSALNKRCQLVRSGNGSSDPPRPDDLLVFTDTKYGHVGIVTEVGEGLVEMIQQNILGRTRQRLSLVVSDAHYFMTEPLRPAGFFRKQLSEP